MQYTSAAPISESNATARKLGYFIGPLLFVMTFFVLPPSQMSMPAWHVCGLALWMASWWITEAMPLPVTSLLPVVILPVGNIIPLKSAIQPFASPIIFLFLGGFLLSLAMEKWHLHMRIVLSIIKVSGVGSKSILAGIMLATTFMGMWISNTATVIMMLPMAVSIALLLSEKMENGEDQPADQNMFAKALVLGVAYSAVFGGLTTFVGSPVNAILQSMMEKTYHHSFTLAEWMSFGVPLGLSLLAFTWLLLTHLYLSKASLCKDVRQTIKDAFITLGPMRAEEKTVAMVFAIVASLWIFSKPLEHFFGIMLSDAVVGIFGGILLFLIPVDRSFQKFALTWKDTSKLPWGILIFFGGSLALSDALTQTGVTSWLSLQLQSLHGINIIAMVLLVSLLIIAVTEFMSNVATVTAFLPILMALASAMQVNPLLILIPATIAASTGFALPGASAANALAYGTGHPKIREMLYTGFILDIASLGAILLFTFTLISWVLGINVNIMPDWAK